MSKLSPEDIAQIAEKAGVTKEQVAEVLRLADEKNRARKADKPKRHTTVVTNNQGPVQTGGGTQIVGGRHT